MIGKTVSHYRVLEKLGQGGMAEVYLALDTSLDRKVALKFLSTVLKTDATARERFLQEARSAAILDHPFICKVYEASEAAADPFIAMEFVEGRSLAHRLLEGPLSAGEALQVVKEVAEALEVAHEQHVVHRDVKPSNIMLTRGGHVKVMDFGLAKRLGPLVSGETDETAAAGLTTPGTIVGTLDYMSPEQIRGWDVDTRSDIFSLGVVLYESLAGTHPFRRGTPMDTGSAILREPVVPLCRFAHDVSPVLEHVIQRMLAKDSEDRYQSVGDLIQDLRLIQQQPSSATGRRLAAGRPLHWERIWPGSLAAMQGAHVLARRRAIAGVGLVALVLMSLLVWWLVHPRETAFGFNKRDWIVICDFENSTGEAVFDKSLDTALRVSITQSSYVNVVPKSRIDQVLRRMKKEATPRIDEPVGREIAQRENIKVLLVPSITGIAGTYAISFTLEDPLTGTALKSDTIRVPQKEEILSGLDRLARNTRESLGESVRSIARQGKPLVKVTTSSLEALKQYSIAIDKHRQGDLNGARPFYENALAIDPNFTAAKASLGMAHCDAYQAKAQWGITLFEGFDRDLGRKLLTDAVGHVDGLTDRERYGVLAFYARAVENDLPKAVQHLQVLAGMYPDESSTRNNLGWFHRQMGHLDDAEREYKEAVRIDPGFMICYDSLSGIYLYDQGRVSDAIALIQKQIAQNDSYFRAYDNLGWAYLGKSEYEKARVAFEKAAALNPKWVHAFFRASHSYRLQKQYREALQPLEQIRESDDASVHYQRGLLYLLLRDKHTAEVHLGRYRGIVEKQLRKNPKDASLYIEHALVLARLGHVQRALEARRKSVSIDPKDCFSLAVVSAALGRTDEALDQLQRALEKGFTNYIWMKIHPDLESLYGHPRFEAMLARVLR